jgi:tetratricopeptide (TPR) repeat protein
LSLSAGAIPIVLTFLLVFVGWRMVFSFNQDLIRVRAWGVLARRSLPFLALTAAALSIPLVQGVREGWVLPAWVLVFGGALVAANFFSMPLDERRAGRAFRSGDYAAAANLYRKLVEERPLARYWTFLAAALGNDGRHEEAIDASTKAVELDPEYGLAYYNRALILRNMGRKSRAAKDLKRALDAQMPRRFKTAARRVLEEL